MAGKRVGYVRVSTTDQNADRQLEAVKADRIFTDEASGKDTQRPALAELLAYVRDGDTVAVQSMDRLARNLEDLLRTVKGLTKRGVRVEFIKESLTFTGDDSAIANLLLQVMGAVAEFERSLILERQRQGIALAKAKGVYKGRKWALTAAQAADVRRRAQVGEKKAALAREYGIGRTTLHTCLKDASYGQGRKG